MPDLIRQISDLWADYGELLWDYIVGLLFWAVAALLPFRRILARKAVFWDIVGLVSAFIFATIVDEVLQEPLGWARKTPLVHHWYGFVYQLHPLAGAVLYLIFSDLLVYWAHRSMHGRRLWNIHAWHHAPTHVYWVSGLRGSLQDTFFIYAPYAVAYLIFPVLQPMAAWVTALIVGSFNPHLIHSNLRIPFSRQVEYVLVTPRYHFVHHAANKRFGNSNYSKMFTWWDHLFGTYTNPETVPADQPLGLGYEASQWKMALGIQAAPEADPQTSVMQASS